jgi:hypothetical protein
MTAEAAAKELDAKLRRYAWYVSTGVGENEFGKALYVYVSSLSEFSRLKVGETWQGYAIIPRLMRDLRLLASG